MRLKLPIKGTLFLNSSSGLRLPPAELSAIEDAARSAGLEVIPLTATLDVTEAVRDRIMALVASETYGERFVTRILGPELGL